MHTIIEGYKEELMKTGAVLVTQYTLLALVELSQIGNVSVREIGETNKTYWVQLQS